MNEHSQLIKKFKLTPDIDFFVDNEGTKIIKKPGFLKIKRIINANVSLQLIKSSEDHKYCVIKATGEAVLDNNKRESESFGEASPENNHFEYPIAIAQKRAEGRVVIDLAGLSEEGWITEDELSTVTKVKGSIVVDSQPSIDKAKSAIAEKGSKKTKADDKIKNIVKL